MNFVLSNVMNLIISRLKIEHLETERLRDIPGHSNTKQEFLELVRFAAPPRELFSGVTSRLHHWSKQNMKASVQNNALLQVPKISLEV
jgi:hypothetical protein